MIELINIQKTYQTKTGATEVLKDINLSVSAGEIFGVIGPSGAGKSTLIRCVNLLERPTSGRVLVAGQDIMQLNNEKLREARRKIGMIFQHFNLLSSRTVFDNVALPLEIAGHDKKFIHKTVNDLLDLTGLAPKKNMYPSQLSGGQKQRVAIARALANQPDILLSDEATSALDPDTTHAILQLLNDINRRLKVTILLITHEMQVIKEICDRLAIIEHGRIMEQTHVLEFFTKPKSTVAKNFMRTSLAHHLPEHIQRRLLTSPQPDSNPLLRISFVGEVAEKPLIASLIQKFSLSLNILLANMEQIRDVTVGVMLLELSGTEDQLKQAIQFLSDLGIDAEIIGYVQRIH